MKYTCGLLEEILEEGQAIVLEEYKGYNQRLVIKFMCSCGVETFKKFEMLHVHRLPYCEACSKVKIIEKIKATCMEKYGVDNAGQIPEVIKKIKDTFNTKYGMHALKSPEIIAKRAKTCLEKYGGHPNQNKEVQAKSEATSYHYKEYMMPSGMIVKYQGYEHLALDELVRHY